MRCVQVGAPLVNYGLGLNIILPSLWGSPLLGFQDAGHSSAAPVRITVWALKSCMIFLIRVGLSFAWRFMLHIRRPTDRQALGFASAMTSCML